MGRECVHINTACQTTFPSSKISVDPNVPLWHTYRGRSCINDLSLTVETCVTKYQLNLHIKPKSQTRHYFDSKN